MNKDSYQEYLSLQDSRLAIFKGSLSDRGSEGDASEIFHFFLMGAEAGTQILL